MRLSIAIALGIAFGIAFGFALIPAATAVVTAVPRWSMHLARAVRSLPFPSRRQIARVIFAGLVVALLAAWVACDRAMHCPTC